MRWPPLGEVIALTRQEMDLADPASVAARIPTRTNDDDRYFGDTYQFMPAQGYTAMFERMLANPSSTVKVSTALEDIKDQASWNHMIYTGPIDAIFDHCYGALPYRSLRFKHLHLANCEQFQTTGTVNYPNDHAYTRITEFKHLTGEQHVGRSIVNEYPQAEGDPYYPVPRPENEALYKRYVELAKNRKDMTFVGRLAQYRYYNMAQVVGAALTTAKGLI